MGEKLGIGPFTYLEQRVRAEVAQARAVGMTVDRTRAAQPTPAGAPTIKGTLRRLMERATDPAWRPRCAAVQEVTGAVYDGPTSDWLEPLYRLAFDDPDSRVRGTCWLELAVASRDGRHIEALTTLTVRAFIERFRARAEFHDKLDRGARHWLWQLAEELEKPEKDRAALRNRKEYLTQLAGDDGPFIDSLQPEEAARYLHHQDPGHRLAALEALSRTGRASTAHRSTLAHLLSRTAPEEAVRFSDDMAERRRLSELATSARESRLAAELGERILRLIATEPEPPVRTGAVRTLGHLYQASGDRDIERFLAGVVLDGARADHMRFAAFEALMRVHGAPASAMPLARAANRSAEESLSIVKLLGGESVPNFDWAADVDWAFVNECAHRL